MFEGIAVMLDMVEITSKKGEKFRLVKLGNMETFTQVDMFVSPTFVLPEMVKKGTKVKVRFNLEKVNYALRAECLSLEPVK